MVDLRFSEPLISPPLALPSDASSWPVYEPADFDVFWAAALAEVDGVPVNPELREVHAGLATLEVFDVTFTGAAGGRVSAWLLLPRVRRGSLPCIVEFVGSGGGRESWMQHLLWASAGFAHLILDSRGARTDVSDPFEFADRPGWGAGVVTRGLESADHYWYRRVIVDAVRAIESAASLRRVDARRIITLGSGHGGAIALAATALSPHVAATALDGPFMCHWAHGLRTSETAPFREVADYIRRRPGSAVDTLKRLGYYDGVNFARRAAAPSLWSIALEDRVCPPGGVRAAFEAYAGSHELIEYPYSDHPDCAQESTQRFTQLVWLGDTLAA